jgi:hypothetical protein
MPEVLNLATLPYRSTYEMPVAPGPLLSGRLAMGAEPPTFRSRGSDTWLLFYTLAGRGFHRSLAGRAIAVAPGDVSLFAPRVTQEYGAVPGSTWDLVEKNTTLIAVRRFRHQKARVVVDKIQSPADSCSKCAPALRMARCTGWLGVCTILLQ